MLRRNGAQSILTNCYLLTSHFFPIHPQLTFLFSILSFSCHSSSNSLCLSKVTLEETLSAKVTGMNKGLGFRFGQTGIQPVWAGLCKTWLDWLSQLLPQCAGCGPHSIQFNPTVFHARLCKEEGNVCSCSPLLDVFCICSLPQRGRSGCKIYLGQSYKVSTLVPCLSSLGGSEYLNSICFYPVDVSALCMVHSLQETRRTVLAIIQQRRKQK